LSLEDIIQETNTFYCLECGKCSGVCPVARFDPQYSPRVVVEEALLGLSDDLIHDKKLFSCLTCYTCQLECPSDVDYPLFMRKVRSLAQKEGEHGYYAHSGQLQSLSRMMSNPNIRQKRLDWLPPECHISQKGEIMLFIGCSPYFEPVFDDIPVRTLNIAEASIKILNYLGINPVVLPDEKCCGHDMLWTGDVDTFRKLAKHNVSIINAAGVKKVIFFCPEGYRTFKKDYPEFFDVDFEVQHLSEFLAQRIENDGLKFKKVERKVTYQDPCRLGRHMGVYEEPRKVIEAIPGVELLEMKRNRENSLCCGTSCFTNCDSYSKLIRMDRLSEAKATGADTLITCCPKCQTHFRCAMTNKGEEKGTDVEIEVMDLANLVAESLLEGKE
jgi:Fe-S oxidoreductase